ncbi:LOW QUALITY PROTEIN: Proteinase inhibitor I3, Kunitz legume [Dillenia turbinata]|uniref:Proteinase inhibitor I3, Kunitz legume n=1 Tax=Dillenia turbinata TaxID=194707 RepID=A0AAN8V142_9MAGN
MNSVELVNGAEVKSVALSLDPYWYTRFLLVVQLLCSYMVLLNKKSSSVPVLSLVAKRNGWFNLVHHEEHNKAGSETTAMHLHSECMGRGMQSEMRKETETNENTFLANVEESRTIYSFHVVFLTPSGEPRTERSISPGLGSLRVLGSTDRLSRLLMKAFTPLTSFSCFVMIRESSFSRRTPTMFRSENENKLLNVNCWSFPRNHCFKYFVLLDSFSKVICDVKNQKALNGLPLKFLLPENKRKATSLSSDVNIGFHAATTCIQSTGWKIETLTD